MKMKIYQKINSFIGIIERFHLQLCPFLGVEILDNKIYYLYNQGKTLKEERKIAITPKLLFPRSQSALAHIHN